METLTKKELLDLLHAYSNYVTEFYDKHDRFDTATCIEEFYYNDYMGLLTVN